MTRFKVAFFLRNVAYAQRLWFGVPRVGDEVMLRREGGALVPHRVLRVVWGNEDERFTAHEGQVQQVNVEVEEVT